MSVSADGPGRARVRVARTARAALCGVLVATAALVATTAPLAAASPARPHDALAGLAAAWQRARTGEAIARAALADARNGLAVAESTAATLDHEQDLVRRARHVDPLGEPGGPDALGPAVDLAAQVLDRAAAVEHDRSVTAYEAVTRASVIEGYVAHEVARRGHADEGRLRAEWDRAPTRSVDAMAFALAQAGKPYVFAASGPSSYDCSGLTMAAWGSVGVHLTHFAATQYRETDRVAPADLAPGDLVFFGSDLGHVGLYLGQLLMVHAPHSGDVVRVASIVRSGDVRTGRVRG